MASSWTKASTSKEEDAGTADVEAQSQQPEPDTPRSAAAAATAARPPVAVVFRSLNYEVSTGGRFRRRHHRLHLLRGVSGYIRPHELLAALGPSGSG